MAFIYFFEDFVGLTREHLPRLIVFFSWGMLFPLIAIAVYIAVGIGLTRLLRRIVVRNTPALQMVTSIAVLSLIAIAGGSLLWLSRASSKLTREERLANATRHPLNLLDLHDNLHTMIHRDGKTDQQVADSSTPFTYDRAHLAEEVSDRMQQMRMNVVVESEEKGKSVAKPDILFIICESLRRSFWYTRGIFAA